MASDTERELLTVAGREVAISNPHKVLFPGPGHTKLDLARYHLAIADGALRSAGNGPTSACATRTGSAAKFILRKRAAAPAARHAVVSLPDASPSITQPCGSLSRKMAWSSGK